MVREPLFFQHPGKGRHNNPDKPNRVRFQPKEKIMQSIGSQLTGSRKPGCNHPDNH